MRSGSTSLPCSQAAGLPGKRRFPTSCSHITDWRVVVVTLQCGWEDAWRSVHGARHGMGPEAHEDAISTCCMAGPRVRSRCALAEAHALALRSWRCHAEHSSRCAGTAQQGSQLDPFQAPVQPPVQTPLPGHGSQSCRTEAGRTACSTTCTGRSTQARGHTHAKSGQEGSERGGLPGMQRCRLQPVEARNRRAPGHPTARKRHGWQTAARHQQPLPAT